MRPFMFLTPPFCQGQGVAERGLDVQRIELVVGKGASQLCNRSTVGWADVPICLASKV